jgi:HK97 family phage major capsid protein
MTNASLAIARKLKDSAGQRSDEFAFQNDLVSFRAIIRLDGALVDANGIKLFQNSAT